jgi:hypothetical protein
MEADVFLKKLSMKNIGKPLSDIPPFFNNDVIYKHYIIINYYTMVIAITLNAHIINSAKCLLLACAHYALQLHSDYDLHFHLQATNTKKIKCYGLDKQEVLLFPLTSKGLQCHI